MISMRRFGRLAASIVLASRELGMGSGRCHDAVLTMAESYRQHMGEYAHMRGLHRIARVNIRNLA